MRVPDPAFESAPAPEITPETVSSPESPVVKVIPLANSTAPEPRGSGAVELASGITLTTGDSGDDTVSGVISGAGALSKAGSGTLTLSGSNTYSGSTTLSAGTIAISSSANVGATPGSADSDNIIFNGGTLNTT